MSSSSPASVAALALIACACVLSLASTSVAAAAMTTTRPIIGILTLPCYEGSCKTSQYFPASYVKFVEAAGARVAPLKYDMPSAELQTMMRGLNGVLFTGGGADLTDGQPFFEQVKAIFGAVVQMNQNGIHFPLWGTCLGFEAIVRACSADPNILSGNFSSWNYSAPIVPTPATVASRMFSAPGGPETLKAITSAPLPFHNHHSGVTPAAFEANAKLSSFFNVLATNVDRDAHPFVTLIEGVTMPVYGSQFHPEKAMFEWNTFEGIDHSRAAVRAMQHFADFFVEEARQNSQSFGSAAAENPLLIYNWQPVFTGLDATADFVQNYYF